jgi:hypothetical protein
MYFFKVEFNLITGVADEILFLIKYLIFNYYTKINPIFTIIKYGVNFYHFIFIGY